MTKQIFYGIIRAIGLMDLAKVVTSIQAHVAF